MLDEIRIVVTAGAGGNGAVSFRRERYVPRGGPDGGDGGRGGDIVIEADASLATLDHLRKQRTIRAEDGRNGAGQKKAGRHGEETVVKVPVGTVVWRTNATREHQIADLTRPGMRIVVAKGGDKGRGNAKLTTSTRRTPRFAERGLLGETARLRLELRLIADVGLVGLPNAGKSSLLRAVSKATPKVGAYPFTTLEPNLGVVERDNRTIVLADIPGLIEGAHGGMGLGTAFLRHIGRTRVLLHVVDATASDPEGDIAVVRGELEAFGEGLAQKPWVVALNKIDLPAGRERAAALATTLDGKPNAISAATGEGVEKLVEAVWEIVDDAVENEPSPEPPVVEPGPDRRAVKVVRVRGGYRLRGERPERAAALLGTESEEARAELARRLQRMGALSALRKAGIADGDSVRIGEIELVWPL